MAPYPLLFLSILLFPLLFNNSEAAPPHCRTCTKNCSSGLEDELHENTVHGNGIVENLLESNQTTRVRRNAEGGVTRAPCNALSIEMILIPVALAMIPLALCALVLCTCFCGPKESRGKMPDNLIKAAIGGSLREKNRQCSEDMELEYKDGYVQRKDSSKTKFSTVVSVIEPRRDSAWSIRTNASLERYPSEVMGSEQEEKRKNSSRELYKVPSSSSIVRFSDQVSVLGVDELPKR